MFKKMFVQKRREQVKDYEKQEKRIKELKAHGKSAKVAEKKTKDALTRKQEKNRSGKTAKAEDEDGPQELLARPKEYIVKFRFPDPSPLQPPILGLHSRFYWFLVEYCVAYFFLNLQTSHSTLRVSQTCSSRPNSESI